MDLFHGVVMMILLRIEMRALHFLLVGHTEENPLSFSELSAVIRCLFFFMKVATAMASTAITGTSQNQDMSDPVLPDGAGKTER